MYRYIQLYGHLPSQSNLLPCSLYCRLLVMQAPLRRTPDRSCTAVWSSTDQSARPTLRCRLQCLETRETRGLSAVLALAVMN